MTTPNETSTISTEQKPLLGNAPVQNYSDANGADTSESDASPFLPSVSNHTKAFFLPYKDALINLSKEGWPTVSTRFIELTVDTASWIMLGWLNEETLAATSLMISSVIILRSIMAVFLFYISREVRTSNANLGNTLLAGWGFALMLSVPSMILAYFAHHIFRAMGEPENDIAITQEFLNAYLWSLPPTLMSIASQRIDIGIGRAWQMFLFTLPTQLLILALGYPLVSSFPEYAVEGMGYIRIFSSVTYLALTAASYKFFAAYQDRGIFKFSKEAFKTSLKNISQNGAIMASYAFFELISASSVLLCVGIIGKQQALADIQPAAQLSSYLANLTYALGIACGTTSIKLVNDKFYSEARKYAQLTNLMCLSLPIITTVAFLSIGNKFVEIFVKNKNDVNLNTAWTFCLIALIGQIFDAFRNANAGMLFAYGDTKSASKSNVATSMLINLPILLLATLAFESAELVASARTIAIAISAMSLFAVYLKKANNAEKPVKQDEENQKQFESNNNMEVIERVSYRKIDAATPKNAWCNFFSNHQPEEKCCSLPCTIL